MPANNPEARNTFAARARAGQRAKILHEIDPHGTLDPDAAQLRVDEIIRARLTTNGRAGAAKAAANAAELRRIRHQRDQITADIDTHLDGLAAIAVRLTDMRADIAALGGPR